MKTITLKSSEVKNGADAILWHLKTYGTITSYEAIKEYGIIFNHRKNGYDIDSTPLKKKTRFGRSTTISKYIYTVPPEQLIQEILWQ